MGMRMRMRAYSCMRLTIDDVVRRTASLPPLELTSTLYGRLNVTSLLLSRRTQSPLEEAVTLPTITGVPVLD
jgi:hypothetical protein